MSLSIRGFRPSIACGLGQGATSLIEPRFRRPNQRLPLFDEIARRGPTIWLHPVRGPSPDYPTEKKSRYEIWWCFKWPYDSSVALAPLVFFRAVRPASESADHHPPHGRDDPVLRRSHRAGLGS